MERNNRLDLVYQRNQLIAKLMFFFYILSLTINLFVDPNILVFIAPVGLLICLTVFLMAKKKTLATLTMYTSIFLIFSFFSLLIYYEPLLINFIYIWLGLIMSSIYHRVKPILFSSVLTSIATIYFFFQFQQQLFPYSDRIDVIYVVLFSWLITAFLVYASGFTEKLLYQAEQKTERTSQELIKTKGYLNSLFNHLTEPIVIHDENGKILQVNKGYELVYGWKNDEVMGQEMPQLQSDQLPFLQKKWRTVMEGSVVQEIEMDSTTVTGDRLETAMSVSTITTDDGDVVALATIIRDITEKKQTEEWIRRSEKLSVVGQLAAGVAHEIRNPITVISGFLQLAQQRDRLSKTHIPVMLSELARINKIISEFLLLAKPGTDRFEHVPIRPLIEEVLTLLNTNAIMKSISIYPSFFITDTTIECEPDQIKQVLINLLKNSIEAMEHGGKIKVLVQERDQHTVHIQIQDDGEGIPQEVLKKITEPFFTTKEKGTGLGLMVCERIVEHHQGKMEITSIAHTGTTVDLYLKKVLWKQEVKHEHSSSKGYYKDRATVK